MRDDAPVRTLLIDNYDSYTYNLYQQLWALNGCEPVVVRNDECSWAELAELGVHNAVISPGPGRPEVSGDFGVCRDLLANAAFPVLGVCLGHQGIAVAYGGRTVPAPVVMHGRLSRIQHDDALFAGIPQDFEAVRYHSLVVEEPLPPGLRVIARADDGTVMGLAAVERPLYGVQFHPESILTRFGDRIMANFRDLTHAWRRDRPAPPSLPPPAPSLPPPVGEGRGGGKLGRPSPTEIGTDPAPLTVTVDRVPGPVDAEALFEAVAAGRPAVWLDSAAQGTGTGRFSYLTADGGELRELVTYDAAARTVRVDREGAAPDVRRTTLFDELAGRLGRWAPKLPDLPFPFAGGYVGWIGYECKSDCGGEARHRSDTADAALLFADRLVVLDHDAGDVYLVALAATDRGRAESERWVRSTRQLLRNLPRGPASPPPPAGCPVEARPDRDRARYLADIRRCQELLTAGETYEVCLTNQFRAPAARPPWETYRRLRRLNPAPYGAYLDLAGAQVLSSSPECLARFRRDGCVDVKPIKGTAGRDPDPERDRRLAADLAAGTKDRAENLMIVDLLRNDLGRVCRPGSVHVPSLMAVESFRTVHQLVSTIRGHLRPETTAIDCLRAIFPGGSMTGAPKIRTMRIIDEIEGRARGVYSGGIGYLGVDGAGEFSIMIRTLVQRGGEVSAGAGGAVTVLSDPEQEWLEAALKAGAVLGAIDARIAGEGA